MLSAQDRDTPQHRPSLDQLAGFDQAGAVGAQALYCVTDCHSR